MSDYEPGMAQACEEEAAKAALHDYAIAAMRQTDERTAMRAEDIKPGERYRVLEGVPSWMTPGDVVTALKPTAGDGAWWLVQTKRGGLHTAARHLAPVEPEPYRPQEGDWVEVERTPLRGKVFHVYATGTLLLDCGRIVAVDAEHVASVRKIDPPEPEPEIGEVWADESGLLGRADKLFSLNPDEEPLMWRAAGSLAPLRDFHPVRLVARDDRLVPEEK